MNYHKKKTLLILSQFFWPEKFRINELAIKLNKKYEVKVITSIPNYPNGIYFDNYGYSKNRIELHRKIEINRIITYPRRDGSSLNLFFNYLTFNIFSFFKIIFFRQKIDCIFIPATSPLTQSLAAIFLKKFFNYKIVIWLQDIFPESFYLKKKSLKNFSYLFNRLAKYIFWNSDMIFLQNKEMAPYVDRYFINEKRKLYVLENWTEDIFINSKIKIINKNVLNFVLAGNLGEAQAIPEFIKSMPKLKSLFEHSKKEILIHIVGTGVKLNSLIKSVEEFGLKNYIKFYGRLSYSSTKLIFDKCQFGISLFTSNEKFLEKIVPSRFISYVASNLIILTNSNGTQRKIIESYKCGYFNKNLLSLFKFSLDLDNKQLIKMINNSKKLFYEKYDKNKIFSNFEKELDGLFRN